MIIIIVAQKSSLGMCSTVYTIQTNYIQKTQPGQLTCGSYSLYVDVLASTELLKARFRFKFFLLYFS